jgi:hypothetical protein
MFFIWASRVIPALSWKRPVVTTLVAIALTWSVGSSLRICPHYLSYFNELVGGPTGGPAHLINSNVDWGQDLFKLKSWLCEHPDIKKLKLAYFGSYDPHYAGLAYTWPVLKEGPANKTYDAASELEPGWYAISINFVRGCPGPAYTGDGNYRMLKQGELVRFQQLKPVALAGYSIYIYYIPEAQ